MDYFALESLHLFVSSAHIEKMKVDGCYTLKEKRTLF